jgi:hypothetical protein
MCRFGNLLSLTANSLLHTVIFQFKSLVLLCLVAHEVTSLQNKYLHIEKSRLRDCQHL